MTRDKNVVINLFSIQQSSANYTLIIVKSVIIYEVNVFLKSVKPVKSIIYKGDSIRVNPKITAIHTYTFFKVS